MIQEFKPLPEAFKKLKMLYVRRILPFYILVITGLFVYFYVSAPAGDTSSLIMFPVVIVAIGIGMFSSVTRIAKKQKAFLESYSLMISDNSITRRQHETGELTVYFNEVKSIVKSKNGFITVYAADRTEHILIPMAMENQAALEAALLHIQPFSNKRPLDVKYTWVVVLVMLAAMGCIVLSSNKIVVACAAVVFAAISGWSIYEQQRNQNLPESTRKSLPKRYLIMAIVLLLAMAKIFTGFDNMGPKEETPVKAASGAPAGR